MSDEIKKKLQKLKKAELLDMLAGLLDEEENEDDELEEESPKKGLRRVSKKDRPNKFFDMPEAQMFKDEPGWKEGATPTPRPSKNKTMVKVKCAKCKKTIEVYRGAVFNQDSNRCDDCSQTNR